MPWRCSEKTLKELFNFWSAGVPLKHVRTGTFRIPDRWISSLLSFYKAVFLAYLFCHQWGGKISLLLLGEQQLDWCQCWYKTCQIMWTPSCDDLFFLSPLGTFFFCANNCATLQWNNTTRSVLCWQLIPLSSCSCEWSKRALSLLTGCTYSCLCQAWSE